MNDDELAGRPSGLLLDDCASNLDVETEEAVCSAIYREFVTQGSFDALHAQSVAFRKLYARRCFICVPPTYYGGTVRVVSYLTEELVQQGHQVALYASGDSRTGARLVPGNALSRPDRDRRYSLLHAGSVSAGRRRSGAGVPRAGRGSKRAHRS